METKFINNSGLGNDSILQDVIPATPDAYPKSRKYRKKLKRAITKKENAENYETYMSEAAKLESKLDTSIIPFTAYDYDSLAYLNLFQKLRLEVPTAGSFCGPRDFNRPFVYISNEEISRLDKKHLYKIYKLHLMGFYICEQNKHTLLTSLESKHEGIQLLFMCLDNLPVNETFISVYGYVDFIDSDLHDDFYVVVKFFREESFTDTDKLKCRAKSVRQFVPTICFSP